MLLQSSLLTFYAPLQYRTSRTSGQRRAVNQPDHDVFEGLPIRQWRKRPISVKPHVEKPDPNTNPILPSGYPELPMPKDANLLPENSLAILRAARMGLIKKETADDGGDGRKNGHGEESMDEQSGLITQKWAMMPRESEDPEPEFLAKRRKGLPSLYGVEAVPRTTAGPMRKTKIRKIDTGGKNLVWEVLVPEGQSIDGEIAEDLFSPTEAPPPGTIVEGVGIANANGVVVAGGQPGPTPPRRKPHPPKRKPKGRPLKDRKRVTFTRDANGETNRNAVAVGDPSREVGGPAPNPAPPTDGDVPMDETGLVHIGDQGAEEGNEEESEAEEEEATNHNGVHSSNSPTKGLKDRKDSLQSSTGVPASEETEKVATGGHPVLTTLDKQILGMETDKVQDNETPVPAPNVLNRSDRDEPELMEGVVESIPATFETTKSLDITKISDINSEKAKMDLEQIVQAAGQGFDLLHEQGLLGPDLLEAGLAAKASPPGKSSPGPVRTETDAKDTTSSGAPTSTEDQIMYDRDAHDQGMPSAESSSGTTASGSSKAAAEGTVAFAIDTIEGETRSPEPQPQSANNGARGAHRDQISSVPQDSPTLDSAVSKDIPLGTVPEQRLLSTKDDHSPKRHLSSPSPNLNPLEQKSAETPNVLTPNSPNPVAPLVEHKARSLDSPRAPTMSPPTPTRDSKSPDIPIMTTKSPRSHSLQEPPSSDPDNLITSHPHLPSDMSQQVPGLDAIPPASPAPPPSPPLSTNPLQLSPPTANGSQGNDRIDVEAAPLVPDPQFNAEIPHEHNPLDGFTAPKINTEQAVPSESPLDQIPKLQSQPSQGSDKDEAVTFEDGEEDLLGNFEKSLASSHS